MMLPLAGQFDGGPGFFDGVAALGIVAWVILWPLFLFVGSLAAVGFLLLLLINGFLWVMRRVGDL